MQECRGEKPEGAADLVLSGQSQLTCLIGPTLPERHLQTDSLDWVME